MERVRKIIFFFKVLLSFFFFLFLFLLALYISVEVFEHDFTWLCLVDIFVDIEYKLELFIGEIFYWIWGYVNTFFVLILFLYRFMRIRTYIFVFYENLVKNYGKHEYEEVHSGRHPIFFYNFFSFSGRRASKWEDIKEEANVPLWYKEFFESKRFWEGKKTIEYPGPFSNRIPVREFWIPEEDVERDWRSRLCYKLIKMKHNNFFNSKSVFLKPLYKKLEDWSDNYINWYLDDDADSDSADSDSADYSSSKNYLYPYFRGRMFPGRYRRKHNFMILKRFSQISKRKEGKRDLENIRQLVKEKVENNINEFRNLSEEEFSKKLIVLAIEEAEKYHAFKKYRKEKEKKMKKEIVFKKEKIRVPSLFEKKSDAKIYDTIHNSIANFDKSKMSRKHLKWLEGYKKRREEVKEIKKTMKGQRKDVKKKIENKKRTKKEKIIKYSINRKRVQRIIRYTEIAASLYVKLYLIFRKNLDWLFNRQDIIIDEDAPVRHVWKFLRRGKRIPEWLQLEVGRHPDFPIWESKKLYSLEQENEKEREIFMRHRYSTDRGQIDYIYEKFRDIQDKNKRYYSDIERENAIVKKRKSDEERRRQMFSKKKKGFSWPRIRWPRKRRDKREEYRNRMRKASFKKRKERRKEIIDSNIDFAGIKHRIYPTTADKIHDRVNFFVDNLKNIPGSKKENLNRKIEWLHNLYVEEASKSKGVLFYDKLETPSKRRANYDNYDVWSIVNKDRADSDIKYPLYLGDDLFDLYDNMEHVDFYNKVDDDIALSFRQKLRNKKMFSSLVRNNIHNYRNSDDIDVNNCENILDVGFHYNDKDFLKREYYLYKHYLANIKKRSSDLRWKKDLRMTRGFLDKTTDYEYPFSNTIDVLEDLWEPKIFKFRYDRTRRQFSEVDYDNHFRKQLNSLYQFQFGNNLDINKVMRYSEYKEWMRKYSYDRNLLDSRDHKDFFGISFFDDRMNNILRRYELFEPYFKDWDFKGWEKWLYLPQAPHHVVPSFSNKELLRREPYQSPLLYENVVLTPDPKLEKSIMSHLFFYIQYKYIRRMEKIRSVFYNDLGAVYNITGTYLKGPLSVERRDDLITKRMKKIMKKRRRNQEKAKLFKNYPKGSSTLGYDRFARRRVEWRRYLSIARNFRLRTLLNRSLRAEIQKAITKKGAKIFLKELKHNKKDIRKYRLKSENINSLPNKKGKRWEIRKKGKIDLDKVMKDMLRDSRYDKFLYPMYLFLGKKQKRKEDHYVRGLVRRTYLDKISDSDLLDFFNKDNMSRFWYEDLEDSGIKNIDYIKEELNFLKALQDLRMLYIRELKALKRVKKRDVEKYKRKKKRVEEKLERSKKLMFGKKTRGLSERFINSIVFNMEIPEEATRMWLELIYQTEEAIYRQSKIVREYFNNTMNTAYIKNEGLDFIDDASGDKHSAYKNFLLFPGDRQLRNKLRKKIWRSIGKKPYNIDEKDKYDFLVRSLAKDSIRDCTHNWIINKVLFENLINDNEENRKDMKYRYDNALVEGITTFDFYDHYYFKNDSRYNVDNNRNSLLDSVDLFFIDTGSFFYRFFSFVKGEVWSEKERFYSEESLYNYFCNSLIIKFFLNFFFFFFNFFRRVFISIKNFFKKIENIKLDFFGLTRSNFLDNEFNEWLSLIENKKNVDKYKWYVDSTMGFEDYVDAKFEKLLRYTEPLTKSKTWSKKEKEKFREKVRKEYDNTKKARRDFELSKIKMAKLLKHKDQLYYPFDTVHYADYTDDVLMKPEDIEKKFFQDLMGSLDEFKDNFLPDLVLRNELNELKKDSIHPAWLFWYLFYRSAKYPLAIIETKLSEFFNHYGTGLYSSINEMKEPIKEADYMGKQSWVTLETTRDGYTSMEPTHVGHPLNSFKKYVYNPALVIVFYFTGISYIVYNALILIMGNNVLKNVDSLNYYIFYTLKSFFSFFFSFFFFFFLIFFTKFFFFF